MTQFSIHFHPFFNHKSIKKYTFVFKVINRYKTRCYKRFLGLCNFPYIFYPFSLYLFPNFPISFFWFLYIFCLVRQDEAITPSGRNHHYVKTKASLRLDITNMIFRRNEHSIFLQSASSFDTPLQEANDLSKTSNYSLSTDLKTF